MNLTPEQIEEMTQDIGKLWTPVDHNPMTQSIQDQSDSRKGIKAKIDLRWSTKTPTTKRALIAMLAAAYLLLCASMVYGRTEAPMPQKRHICEIPTCPLDHCENWNSDDLEALGYFLGGRPF